jgi:hypothetical protein
VLRNADKRSGDWLTHGRNYAETRFSHGVWSLESGVLSQNPQRPGPSLND